MNPWRKAFARHHCPDCNVPVLRIRPTLAERLRHEVLLLAAFALVAWVAATVVQWWGVERATAWVVAFVASTLLLLPAAHVTRRYRCLRCAREMGFAEVRSRGWALLR